MVRPLPPGGAAHGLGREGARIAGLALVVPPDAGSHEVEQYSCGTQVCTWPMKLLAAIVLQ